MLIDGRSLSVAEVRTSAKDIFDCELARMSDEIVFELVERWRHKRESLMLCVKFLC